MANLHLLFLFANAVSDLGRFEMGRAKVKVKVRPQLYVLAEQVFISCLISSTS